MRGTGVAAPVTTDPQAASKLSLPFPELLGSGVTTSTRSRTRSGQSCTAFGFPARTTNTIVEV